VFDEVQALYGPQMTSLSGGLVYEYSQEEQNYGLVVINSNGSISLRQDYDNLQGQYNKLNKDTLESANPASTGIKAPNCSPSLIVADAFSKNFTIPAVCPGCQALIDSGISNPVNGKLVDVTTTKPKQTVYGSNGAAVQGLELQKLSNDGANSPGGQTTTGTNTGSSSSTAPSAAAESKKGAASGLDVRGAWAWGVMFVGALFV
jgi:hypothetical protein